MDDLDLGATIKGFSPGQKVFSRYSLVRLLGRGGMGVVWLAQDEELGRETALKFLPEVLAADRSAVEDMKREVRRAIDLAHPHIVKIHDFITDGRTAAVSMEYIAGGTLSSLRIDQPGRVFHAEDLAKWTAQLCGALDYAHQEAEIVHRDLKPTNLMVDAKGRLRVLDFGIAASISESVTRVSKQAGSSGTPVYMSPQQMMGEDPAVTDDIYAVGATLFELLTGKPPFHAGNILLQVQNKVAPLVNERRQAADHPPVPAAWENAIAACLAKDPDERPRSGADLLRRLEGGAPPVARAAETVAEPPRVPVPVAQPVPVASAAEPTGALPGADTSWVRRLLLAPLVAALPIAATAAAFVFGMINSEPAQAAVGTLVIGTALLSMYFLVHLIIVRPWKRRGSYGVMMFGALVLGLIAVFLSFIEEEIPPPFWLASALMGAGLGACGGWMLNRVAARATFLPSGPVRGLSPTMVLLGQAFVLVTGLAYFGSVLPREIQMARDARRAREAVANEAEWRPKVVEAYRMVFDREPDEAAIQKYLGQAVQNRYWWKPENLRGEMRKSEEGRNGGRLLVPQEFPSISAAISAAQPGNVVVVGPGTYQESISLYRSGHTLRGAGPGKVIVQTDATTNTLTVGEAATGAKISGFTFRHSSKTSADRRYTPVWIGAADVEFIDNAVMDADGHGITLNAATNCRILGNEIRNGQWDGIAIYAGTSGTIGENTIRNNQQRGINVVERTGALLIRGNELSFNGNAGLTINKGDGVEIVNNTATNNGNKVANGGIAIFHEAGRPVLRGNKAEGNNGPEIWWVDEAAAPLVGGGNFADGQEIPRGTTKRPR